MAMGGGTIAMGGGTIETGGGIIAMDGRNRIGTTEDGGREDLILIEIAASQAAMVSRRNDVRAVQSLVLPLVEPREWSGAKTV
jgi:hypothetical protein